MVKFNHYEVGLKIINCGYTGVPAQERSARAPSSYWYFYWCDQGEPAVLWNNQEFKLRRGVALLIPVHTVFVVCHPQGYSHFFIHFDAGSPYDMVNPCPVMIALAEDDLRELEEIKAMMLTQDSPPSRYILVNYFLCKMLLRLQAENFQGPANIDERIKKALEIINANYDKPLGNEELSGRLNMSQNNFLRLFKREVGQSPHSYLNYIRIRNARRMLREDKCSIEDISDRLGFSDRYHFSRIFRNFTSVSPAQFRGQSR